MDNDAQPTGEIAEADGSGDCGGRGRSRHSLCEVRLPGLASGDDAEARRDDRAVSDLPALRQPADNRGNAVRLTQFGKFTKIWQTAIDGMLAVW
jgi:hypothetical protein